MKVQLGLLAPPLTEQFPTLADGERLQKDNEAISRLRIQGLLTHAESDRARRRLVKLIAKAIRGEEQQS